MTLGEYRLERKMKNGGNGDIWLAKGPDGERIFKIVRASSADSERYKRFRREIETVRGLDGTGLALLPIYDAALPEDLSLELAWFSMPVAETLDSALAGSSSQAKVTAVRDIARTLADLAALHQIHHRDIKPANLYRYVGRYVVGDFGLVKRLDADDEALTKQNRVPGPRNYLPPDAFLRPNEAQEGPIDVYCLVKTLWVLLTEEVGPPGGQIRADDRWSLSRMLANDKRLADLCRLIEQATSNGPSERPDMLEVADRLTRWLYGLNGSLRSPPGPIEDVATTPDSVREEITSLLDAGRAVVLRETLKREKRSFEERLSALLVARADSPGNGDLASFETEILPVLERFVAALLPLVEHRSELFADQMKEVVRIANAHYARGAYTEWNDLATWAGWWIAHTTGAFAVSVENLGATASVFHGHVKQNLGARTFPTMLTSEAVRVLMASVYEFHGRTPQGYQYKHLVERLGESEFMKAHYPELVGDPEFGAARWIFDLNFLASLWAADREEPVIGFWTTRHGAAVESAQRLREDNSYRQRISREIFGLDLATFDERIPVWLDRLYRGARPLLLFPEDYGVSEAMEVLIGDA
jgi:serine/threonine protein kinase